MTRIKAYVEEYYEGEKVQVIAAKQAEKEIYQFSCTSYACLMRTGMPPVTIPALPPM